MIDTNYFWKNLFKLGIHFLPLLLTEFFRLPILNLFCSSQICCAQDSTICSKVAHYDGCFRLAKSLHALSSLLIALSVYLKALESNLARKVVYISKINQYVLKKTETRLITFRMIMHTHFAQLSSTIVLRLTLSR